MTYIPLCINCGWKEILHGKLAPSRKQEDSTRTIQGYEVSLEKCKGFNPKENQRNDLYRSLHYKGIEKRKKSLYLGGEMLSYGRKIY